MSANPEMLGVRSAAQQLGVHENTLRRWEQRGLVEAIRLPSGVRRFRTDDIAELRARIYESPQSHVKGIEAAASTLRVPVSS